MNIIRDVRRGLILGRKRIDLLKYNFNLKRSQGQAYDVQRDIQMIGEQQRSINLLDFERNREKDLFMIDIYSDQSDFGGLSETELSIKRDESEEPYLNMRTTFVQEQSGLVPINYMLSGFKCNNLVTETFDYLNGFRITMRPPIYPCKFGLYLQTNLTEYEHFIGHILDTRESSHEWVEYEIPVRLMVHNLIKNKMMQAQVYDNFDCKGVTFSVEAEKHSKIDPFELQIKKIDVIYNPEYERIINKYKLPIFFKSLESRSMTYYKQGFLDNGRQQVDLLEEHQVAQEQLLNHQKQMINNLGREDAPPVETTPQKARSIKDRLKQK